MFFRVQVLVLARYSLVSSSVPLFGELVLDISIRMRVIVFGLLDSLSCFRIPSCIQS